MCVCRSIAWMVRWRGWEQINFNYKTGVVNEYFMCNGYFSYLFTPQTDAPTSKCCRRARFVSAHSWNNKKYGCDGAKQLEEYLITWGINNFFTLLLFFSVSFWCVALRLVWSQTSVKDIGSCGHEDIFIVCELQLYRSGQNCHKILSRPFTSKGESERDRERERAIERLYLETTNNAVLSCICNKSVVP